jgi:hypothetical protein
MACPLVTAALLSGPLLKPFFTAVMTHHHRRLKHKEQHNGINNGDDYTSQLDARESCDVRSAYAVLFVCIFFFAYPCTWLSLGEEPGW